MNTQRKALQMLAYPLAIACLLMLASCSTTGPSAKDGHQDVLYVCGCGTNCCQTVSIKPGKCACSKDTVAGHVKKVEGDVALLCMCSPNCNCALDPKDLTKCGCGKPIRKESLKGTGIYFCNCGGSCCNMVSDKPGKCKCGMDLKRVD